jgi:hypothetical protein
MFEAADALAVLEDELLVGFLRNQFPEDSVIKIVKLTVEPVP